MLLMNVFRSVVKGVKKIYCLGKINTKTDRETRNARRVKNSLRNYIRYNFNFKIPVFILKIVLKQKIY